MMYSCMISKLKVFWRKFPVDNALGHHQPIGRGLFTRTRKNYCGAKFVVLTFKTVIEFNGIIFWRNGCGLIWQMSNGGGEWTKDENNVLFFELGRGKINKLLDYYPGYMSSVQ